MERRTRPTPGRVEHSYGRHIPGSCNNSWAIIILLPAGVVLVAATTGILLRLWVLLYRSAVIPVDVAALSVVATAATFVLFVFVDGANSVAVATTIYSVDAVATTIYSVVAVALSALL